MKSQRSISNKLQYKAKLEFNVTSKSSLCDSTIYRGIIVQSSDA